MFRSVFSRMLVTYLLIIAFILLLQSVLLVQLYRRDYYDISSKEMIKEAKEIAGVMAKPEYQTFSAQRMLQEIMSITVKEGETAIWVVTPNKQFTPKEEFTPSKPFIIGDQDAAAMTEEEFTQYFNRVMQGEEVVVEDVFRSRFASPVLSVGVPIVSNESIIGAVFIHSVVEAMQGVVYRLYRHIVFSAAIAVVVGVLLVFLSSSRLIAPLKDMHNLSREIAHGNFNKRVKIESEDEIGELAQSFNKMTDELQRQEELRSGFVANVSHELRSPLTSIHGFAQGMIDGTIEVKDREKYLGIILDETTRLKKLIRELLDLSQFESGNFPLNIESFDINERIRRVIIRYIDRMEEKGIELEVDFRQEQCMVRADIDRIEQVLINLLDNAIKFTPQGGTIKLWSHSSSKKVIVGVSDRGVGIPDEDIPYIFERFYKSDKSHTVKTGTGLGLSIVKTIIDQHRQTISVNSTVGKGTSFVFTLQKDST